ncbi:MAG: hypothetical protein KDK70_41365, partial [Myxococcales bacterium]|nr:hypothetical protein [Myxococcales bacterium]
VVPDWGKCECNSGRLLALVDEGIVAALAQLDSVPVEDAARAEPVRALESDSQVGTGAEEYGASGARSDRRGRLGPMGYTGIGLGALGVGGLVAGVSLVTRPAVVKGVPGALDERSMRTPVVVVAATGGALLAVGIPLLVIDMIVRERRAAVVQPMVGPRLAGISVDVWALRMERRR